MQINFDLNSITKAIDGRKTYIGIAVGMAVVAANHFGILPAEYVPQGLDPNNWVQQEYSLLLSACFRSGLAKLTAPKTAA